MFIYYFSRHHAPGERTFEKLEEAFKDAYYDYDMGFTWLKKIVDTKTGQEYKLDDVLEWAEQNGLD